MMQINTATKLLSQKFTSTRSDHLPNLTRDQLQKLSFPPHLSLYSFQKGEATSTDWYNVVFRISTGLFISDEHYNSEVVSRFEKAMKICDDIRERAMESGTNVWTATLSEINELADCLCAVDEMQNILNRPKFRARLIDIFTQVREYLSSFI